MMLAMRIIKIYLIPKWHPAWPNPTIQWNINILNLLSIWWERRAHSTHRIVMWSKNLGTWNMKQFKVSAFFFLKDFFHLFNFFSSKCHFVLFVVGESQSPKSRNINRLKLSEGDKHAFNCQKNSKNEWTKKKYKRTKTRILMEIRRDDKNNDRQQLMFIFSYFVCTAYNSSAQTSIMVAYKLSFSLHLSYFLGLVWLYEQFVGSFFLFVLLPRESFDFLLLFLYFDITLLVHSI